MKLSYRPDPHITVAGGIITLLVAIVLWIGWVTSQAYAEPPPRAITAEPPAPHSDLTTCRACWKKK